MGAVNRAAIVDAFARQAQYCRRREAPLTAGVIDAAAADVAAGGPLAALFDGFEGDPGKAALALRVAAAVHDLALSGRAGGLQAAYDAVREPAPDAAQRSLAALVEASSAVFRQFLKSPPQTNVINRVAALFPAFSMIQGRFGLPLDLYEPGASGGLLLALDRCRIDYGSFVCGAGPVVVASEWRGPAPALAQALNIGRRRGCDRNPLDYGDPAARRLAHAYIWPEHAARRIAFEAACEVLPSVGVEVERANALDWLARQAIPKEGAATVVFTSVFAVYLSDAETAALARLAGEIAAQACETAPFALVQFEPEEDKDLIRFHVDLTVWPGGERRRIAEAHAHGQWVAPTPAFYNEKETSCSI